MEIAKFTKRMLRLDIHLRTRSIMLFGNRYLVIAGIVVNLWATGTLLAQSTSSHENGVLLGIGDAKAGVKAPPAWTDSRSEEPYPSHGLPWENNTLGMEKIVPLPWTAMEYDSRSVSCWGRRYVFDDQCLPSQITSQGKELFARRPSLSLQIDGQDTLGKTVLAARRVASKPEQVVYETRKNGDNFELLIRTSLEYDGFLLIDLTIRPRRPVTIERLAIELPMRHEVAEFFNRYVEYDFETQRFAREDVTGSFGRLDQPVAMKFNPAVWVGNHEVGMEWSCETDNGWALDDKSKAIEILPRSDATEMRIAVVSKAIRIAEPWRICFALYPTPVKKLPEDWRRFRLTGTGASEGRFVTGDRVYGLTMGESWPVKYPGLPVLEPSQAAGLRLPGRYRQSTTQETLIQTRKTVEENGGHFIPYGALYGMPVTLPNNEWKYYADAWLTAKPPQGSPNAAWGALQGLPKRSTSFYYVCSWARSFQDFLVWHYVEAIKKYNIDAIYLDISSPMAMCKNGNHPHGAHVAAGGQYHPFFAQRRLMQRLYVACLDRQPNFVITQHLAKDPVVCSGFSHVMIKGESLNVVFRGVNWNKIPNPTDPTAYVPDYSRLPEEFFDLQYSARNGYISMLLPQVIKWNEELMRKRPDLLAKYTRTLLARTVLYDVPLWRLRLDYDLYDRVIRAQEKFGGLTASIYQGPWEAGRFLITGGQKLRIAFYWKPVDHKLLMIVSNLGKEPVRERLALDPQALAKAGFSLNANPKITEIYADQPVSIQTDGAIVLDMSPDDLRMILRQ